MRTASNSPIFGCVADPIATGDAGTARTAAKGRGRAASWNEWRRHTADRCVSGEDATVWKWTRAPPRNPDDWGLVF
jgi:hypothetical protein